MNKDMIRLFGREDRTVKRYNDLKFKQCFGLFLLLAMMISLTIACHQESEDGQSDTQVEELRVISLAPSNTEWVFALNAERSLVGRTDQCDTPKEVREIKSLGSLFPPKLEKMIAQRPTDALMIEGHEELKSQLKRFGVRVHTIAPKTIQSLFDGVSELGKVLKREAQAEAWLKRARERLALLKRSTKSPRVLVEVWFSPLTIAGASSYIGDLVKRAGGSLIKGVSGDWPTLNIESAVAFDPEVIFVSTPSLYKQLVADDPPQPWYGMSAVRHKRVYLLDGRLVRPGPRVIDDLRWLSDRLSQTK